MMSNDCCITCLIHILHGGSLKPFMDTQSLVPANSLASLTPKLSRHQAAKKHQGKSGRVASSVMPSVVYIKERYVQPHLVLYIDAYVFFNSLKGDFYLATTTTTTTSAAYWAYSFVHSGDTRFHWATTPACKQILLCCLVWSRLVLFVSMHWTQGPCSCWANILQLSYTPIADKGLTLLDKLETITPESYNSPFGTCIYSWNRAQIKYKFTALKVATDFSKVNEGKQSTKFNRIQSIQEGNNKSKGF